MSASAKLKAATPLVGEIPDVSDILVTFTQTMGPPDENAALLDDGAVRFAACDSCVS